MHLSHLLLNHLNQDDGVVFAADDIQTGDDKSAERSFEQGLALAPKTRTPDDDEALGKIHDEMASLYFDQQKYDKAEEHGDAAARLLPNDPSILTDAAGIKIQLKKLDEAKKLLDAALKDREVGFTKVQNRLVL